MIEVPEGTSSKIFGGSGVLPQLAMAVINEGSRSRVADLFELASDLDEQMSYMITKLEEVQETLSRLTALYPDSLRYGDLESDE